MEYPMICFNGPRPTAEEDWYGVPGKKMPWKHSKYGLISVIIHEVGHNWYPMFMNSDERQWTWMDEGLNSYVQFLAEQYMGRRLPRRRGEPRGLADYMASTQRPIMTQSDSLHPVRQQRLRHASRGPQLPARVHSRARAHGRRLPHLLRDVGL